MAFKTTTATAISLESPEALFRDIRTKRIPGVLSQQADLLRLYVSEALNESDVALQLPTGSGKTLVGLLIGEWRRRKFNERIIYLCPTNQLVHQVVNLATSVYGLKVNGFVGKKTEYDPAAKGEYFGAEAIAVTSYSGLFNSSPFFENPNTIILDDAHSAENYISKLWSLRISKSEHPDIYNVVISIFLNLLSHSDQQRVKSPSSSAWDSNWVEKIPTPYFIERIPELISGLEANVQGTDLFFPWSLLKDHLSACHLFIDTREILLRPIIPPSFNHKPFAEAKQRIYMSATLGEGGDLERITGRAKIKRLQVKGWEKQGIGRRFFLFPERSLNESDTEELIYEMLSLAGRSLVIVPDDDSADQYIESIRQRIGYPTFRAKDIERSKEPFISQKKAIAVVANRYDGIDFPNDECRLLVVAGLPRGTNLQEKFFISRLGSVALLNDRILTRIVQAFGRCTRSPTDFAAVIVEGEELCKHLLAGEHRSFLHPELQAELEFGINQSKDQTSQDFIENLTAFIEQSDAWQKADGEIVNLRENLSRKTLPSTPDLQAAVGYEIAYQKSMWQADYNEAFDAARTVLGLLNDPALRGYRALWGYLAGSAAWLAYKSGAQGFDQHARTHYAAAKKSAVGVSWLVRLANIQGDLAPLPPKDTALTLQVERLENRFETLGTVHDRKYAEEEKFILENIMENESSKFEEAHKRLGSLLGFETGKVESGGSPDPWWILHDDLCLVFEDHSDATSNSIHVTKARQVATHPNWIRANVPLSESANIVPVLITPVAFADTDAIPHLKNVYVWHIDEFRSWAKFVLQTMRDLRRDFPGSGDLVWRATAADRIQSAKLDSSSIFGALLARPAARILKTKKTP